MKNGILFAFFLICIGCSKENNAIVDNTVGQNVSVLVQPAQTDLNYSSVEESHYVVRNTKKHSNKLLLFIGGSSSIPKNYNLVCDYGATIGLDVVSLSYPNETATAPLGSSSDPNIFDNYRDELCFGNPVSNVVSVNTLNCISTRITKLLIYLKASYADQNWGQYLTATNTIIWQKVIVAGHSQGSGHACYLGKKNLVDRVVMFAGPNDFHGYFNAAAHWLIVAGQTPIAKHFSLLHTQDEIVPFNNQVANLRGLGLLSGTQTPTLVDNLSAPFDNAKCMSLNIAANSNHSSPIGGNTKLPAIWNYMFTVE